MTTFTVNARSGLDTNPGTNLQPFKTLERAMTAVVAAAGGAVGDTIVLEGDGNVYTPPVSSGTALTTSAILGKKGVQIIGAGNNSRPVIEGGGLIDICLDYKSGAATKSLVKNVEIRGYRVAGVRVNAVKGVDTDFVVDSCEIHHIIDTRFFGPPDPTARYQDGINISFGNPQIRNTVIHHIGYGGEAHGLFLSTCHNAVVDNCEFYVCRKEAMRDALGLRTQITNNRFWHCTLIHVAQSIGTLLANNFSYENYQFGLSLKHCNDPLAALPTWGLAQGELIRVAHNTVVGTVDEALYIAGNLTTGLAKPAGQVGNQPPNSTNQTGRSWLIEYRNNLFSRGGQQYLWDNPYVRDASVNLDHNVYEMRDGRRPIHFYHRIPEDGFYVETIEALRTNPETLGWENNGRMMAVDFVDEANRDYTPATPIPPTLELPTVWGSQVGARNIRPPDAKWTPNAAIAISSTTDKPTQLPRLVDDLGANTTMDTDTNTEQSFVIDHGSVVPFNHFWFPVFGHQKQSATRTWSLEVSNDNSTWTRIVDHQAFNDHFGSDFSWDLLGTYSARYVKWISHDNFAAYGGIVTPAAAWITWGGLKTAMVTATGAAPPAATVAPANTSLPVISGTAQTGRTLAASTGAWLNNPTSYGYQWRRAGVNISGATFGTYVLVAADEGQAVTVRVRATNAAGFTDAFSASVTPSSPAPTGVAPVNTALPDITTDGGPETGDTVTASTGTWDNAPTSFAYQWTRNTTAISGATGQAYTLVTADERRNIRIEVTATNVTGSTTATSVPIVPQPVQVPTDLPLDPVGTWGIPC